MTDQCEKEFSKSIKDRSLIKAVNELPASEAVWSSLYDDVKKSPTLGSSGLIGLIH